MSQRNSGYERRELDTYETPAWVTQALIPHLPIVQQAIWEPACGSGKMAQALGELGIVVVASDIVSGMDFLEQKRAPGPVEAIVTNPPYNLAPEFIWHAMHLLEPVRGWAAFLLRTDFDHARGRAALFGDCRQFACKIVLRRRIRWFEDKPGSPSFNHAWFVWDWKHAGAPVLRYAA